MSNQKISTKKLKAIVFTDIVDFTKIMGDDIGIEVNQKVRKGDKIYLVNKD